MLLTLMSVPVVAQDEYRDTVSVSFGLASARISASEEARLQSQLGEFSQMVADGEIEVTAITLRGLASIDGSISYNRLLSQHRADALIDYVTNKTSIPASVISYSSQFVDWELLHSLVLADRNVPQRSRVLDIVERAASRAQQQPTADAQSIRQLKQLGGGVPYRYLLRHILPQTRRATMVVSYRLAQPAGAGQVIGAILTIHDPDAEPAVSAGRDTVVVHDTVYVDRRPQKPLYVAAKTNLLYDAAVVPNVGLEVYLGRQWSLAANWEYAWWRRDSKHDYWRIYGGDVELRRWFGAKAAEKPLQGHHAGVYAGMLTYDVEWGGRGYMGPKWSYMFGLSYGYSLPVARRLNLDFNIGLGYLGGKYHEYDPDHGHYVWEVTRQRHWFGPTKAEISLSWLLGHGNVNSKKRKGGR